MARKTFTMPPVPGGFSEEPLDVGKLPVTDKKVLEVGDPFPKLAGKAATGEAISMPLADGLGRERLLRADDENRNRRELLVRAQRLAQLDPVLRRKRRVEDGQVRRRIVDALERLRAIGHRGHGEPRLAQRDLEDAEAARIRVCDQQGGLGHAAGSRLQATGYRPEAPSA